MNTLTLRKSARRRQISQLVLAGYTPPEIAERLGIKEVTVREHCEVLLEQWMTDSDTNFRQKLATELARLQQIENEAMAAWRRSCKPAQSVRKTLERVIATDPLAPDDLFAEPVGLSATVPMSCVQEVHETKGQVGNPQFLAIVKECTAERLRIMGAYKDISLHLNMITPEQMLQFSRAFLDAAKDVVHDPILLQSIQARTLELLPQGVVPPVIVQEPTEPLNGQHTGEDFV